MIKLLAILFIFVFGYWIVKYEHIELYTNTNTVITTPTTTTPYILPIQNAISSGYNAINTNRFKAIDNQQRLDNLNTRINKLMLDIQTTYNISQEKINNPIKFY